MIFGAVKTYIFIEIKNYLVIPPILQTVIPQLGHFPLAIFVPRFVLDSTGFCISTFFLHFTQYPSVIFTSLLSISIDI